jgi:DNA-binding LytR/AlgR family response regulator
MEKLRIIIADDERPAREFLKALLREFEDAELVGEAENGADAVEMIKQLKPDLALLDLRMPEVSGLEAVRLLRKSQMPLVAFVTAYDEYAVQAFEVNAVDYLLKPVEK